MTVINALRFDEYSGVMVCDEQSTYGSASRKIDAADKIQSIISEDIENDEKLSACLGCSGTVLIAAELRAIIKSRLKSLYSEHRKNFIRNDKMEFIRLEDIAGIAFEAIKEIKSRHINSIVSSRYNFDISHFIGGNYPKGKSVYNISQKDITENVISLMSWKGMIEEVRFVFLNRSILAGLNSDGKFEMFTLSMIDGSVNRVQSIFQSVGSGQDVSDLIFINWTMNKTLQQRLNGFAAEDGLLAIINATNAASTNNIGVGGYFNIVIFNGKETLTQNRRVEISDHRAKLACEIASAYQFEFITRHDACLLIGQILLEGLDFDEVNERFFQKSRDCSGMQRFLRGYKRG